MDVYNQSMFWHMDVCKACGGFDENLHSLMDADFIILSGDPFSVYTRVEKVFIDGSLVYDRLDPSRQPVTDFDLGIIVPEGERL